MKKLKIYLETSIFNFAISNQMPDYKEATLRFLDSLGKEPTKVASQR